MATNLEPKPYVVINGVEMPLSLPVEDGPVVLEGLKINNWGRSNMLDSTSPGSLSLTIFDTDGEWVRNQELVLGMEIMIGVRYTDDVGVYRDYKNFRGRIIDAEIEARDESMSTDSGFYVHISAIDKLAELGNRFVSFVTWPYENYDIRRSRIMSVLGGVVASIGGSYPTRLGFEKVYIERKSTIELITEYMAAGCEWINYDPDTNIVGTTGPVIFDTGANVGKQGLRIGAMNDGSGTYGLVLDIDTVYTNKGYYNVNAGGLSATSGIKRSIESGITEVRYEYATTVIDGETGKPMMVAHVAKTGVDENIYGRRTLNIETRQYFYPDEYAGYYVKAAQAAQNWTPPEVEWDTRIPGRGFQNHVHVRNFIGGRVFHDPIFLSRSRYNHFSKRIPIYYVIGGSMTYAKNAAGVMGWVVKPNFAPVVFSTSWTPLKWNTINPSASPVLTWANLNENVTWNDTTLTGQGV